MKKSIITILAIILIYLLVAFGVPFLIHFALVALNHYIPAVPVLNYWLCLLVWFIVDVFVTLIRRKAE